MIIASRSIRVPGNFLRDEGDKRSETTVRREDALPAAAGSFTLFSIKGPVT